jgi:2',3'-cyclic-nucleotide 2'-phosphodiesterase
LVIGMKTEEPLKRFTRRIPSSRFEPPRGPAMPCSETADINPLGLTKAITSVWIDGLPSAAVPDFWG